MYEYTVSTSLQWQQPKNPHKSYTDDDWECSDPKERPKHKVETRTEVTLTRDTSGGTERCHKQRWVWGTPTDRGIVSGQTSRTGGHYMTVHDGQGVWLWQGWCRNSFFGWVDVSVQVSDLPPKSRLKSLRRWRTQTQKESVGLKSRGYISNEYRSCGQVPPLSVESETPSFWLYGSGGGGGPSREVDTVVHSRGSLYRHTNIKTKETVKYKPRSSPEKYRRLEWHVSNRIPSEVSIGFQLYKFSFR